ncbi:VWA domain-containing protein [Thalassotalea euphylliae]|uniref:VWA domain-containing protein n=1 Tax=Thalassotalea euphylliae TaxID=1655234 RepID=UPI003632D47C
MMENFHFIRPLWLLGLLALPLLVWLIKRIQVSQSGWQRILPAHLSKQMIEPGANGKSLSVLPAVVLWVLSIVALAGPAWEKLPQPVYNIERGSVLIMDMSYSMFSTDLSPNRLTRARFKAIDLLDNINEGDIGLVAYAGDAFAISPLTEDINNIKLFLPALSPDLMPELGSNPLAALHLAHDMLANAGHIEGDIYWFTDGIDREDIEDLTQWSAEHQHTVNILGIGTPSGAPIKLPNGELLKDNSGAIVIPKLSEKLLYGVAVNSGGSYQTIRNDISDIKRLITKNIEQAEQKASENEQQGDQWQEAGPYLLLLALPLLLPYFRRGALVALVPLLLLQPQQEAYALDWQQWFKTKDQQGQEAFNKEEYEKAANAFEDPLWQGAAQYKAGNYEAALEAFKHGSDADALYNQGNALAKMQKLDEAIEAYEQALQQNPEHVEATANKALLEQLRDQQQNQQGNDQQQSDSQEQQENEQQQGGDQNQSQNDSQNSSESDEGQQNNQENGSADAEQNQNDEQQNNQDATDQQHEENNTQENEQQQSAEQSQQEAGEAEQQENAQLTEAEQQAQQEQEQKHQQLLKKVTDDPYRLLREKMKLEYQKRRHQGSSNGDKKKW